MALRGRAVFAPAATVRVAVARAGILRAVIAATALHVEAKVLAQIRRGGVDRRLLQNVTVRDDVDPKVVRQHQRVRHTGIQLGVVPQLHIDHEHALVVMGNSHGLYPAELFDGIDKRVVRIGAAVLKTGEACVDARAIDRRQPHRQDAVVARPDEQRAVKLLRR